MKAWRVLGPGRKLLYLAAVVLPLVGLFPFLYWPNLVPPGPEGGIVWLFLIPPTLGFLLGAVNLALIFSGHPPRENRSLWDGILVASLVPDLVLLGFSVFIYAFLRHGIFPVPT